MHNYPFYCEKERKTVVVYAIKHALYIFVFIFLQKNIENNKILSGKVLETCQFYRTKVKKVVSSSTTLKTQNFFTTKKFSLSPF